ncbi:hypothetical protein Adt_22908 [Abeliophyllum distichum]|uniref:Uncharacterized protein n=1 Tax=Abeliophyllum distichum TaxID=126358 RepID=A0ABD1S9C2_9LAMI
MDSVPTSPTGADGAVTFLALLVRSITSSYNRSDDNFSGLNNIPIPEDIIDRFGGSIDRIDLEDVHDDADTQTTIGSSTKRKATKQKAKCWDHFELVPTGKIVNDLPEFKAKCKHCQEKFA